MLPRGRVAEIPWPGGLGLLPGLINQVELTRCHGMVGARPSSSPVVWGSRVLYLRGSSLFGASPMSPHGGWSRFVEEDSWVGPTDPQEQYHRCDPAVSKHGRLQLV